MSYLRPHHKWRIASLFWLPYAVILWPLVAWNLRERRLGYLPDQWYWADLKLWAIGYYIG